MQPTSNPRLVAEHMLMVDGLLAAFDTGTMTMQPEAYRELACWAHLSFAAMDSAALRAMRAVAPHELQGIIENVLHDRRVLCWAADFRVGLSALAELLSLMGRCRK